MWTPGPTVEQLDNPGGEETLMTGCRTAHSGWSDPVYLFPGCPILDNGWCFQSCPLITTHRLAVSSHVHSTPPTVYLFYIQAISTSHHTV